MEVLDGERGVRIVDGGVHQRHVFVDGAEIENVFSIEIELPLDAPTRVRLGVYSFASEIQSTANVTVDTIRFEGERIEPAISS